MSSTRPKWRVESAGYSPLKPLFTEKHIAKLANLLGCSRDEFQAPLSNAALEIGPFLDEWRNPPAKEADQSGALNRLTSDAESLLNRIRELDRRSKQRLLNEYGADGDSEGDRAVALENLQKDVAGFTRLYQNLAVATQRLDRSRDKTKGGAPKKDFERFAAGKLLEACIAIHAETAATAWSRKKMKVKRCIIEALMMIGIAEPTAERAVGDAMVNAQKPPGKKGSKTKLPKM